MRTPRTTCPQQKNFTAAVHALYAGAAAAARLLLCLLPAAAFAQQAAPLTAPQFAPAAPTTIDMVYVKLPGRCAAAYRTPAYEVSITDLTHIRITERITFPLPPCPAPPTPDTTPPLLVEIGRLPAAAYTVDVLEANELGVLTVLRPNFMNLTLQVGQRTQTSPVPVPAPWLNYSGHWWDPADSGSGFLIWQSSADSILVAWFTYGLDGKPAWYTLQGGSWVNAKRYESMLIQSSRAPNPNAPGTPGNPVLTAGVIVGTAAIDFGGADGIDTGVFTATLTAGGTATRNIRRFGK